TRGERRFADEPVAPQLVEQFFFADDGASVLQQVRQHVEDLGLELDLATFASKDHPTQVQLAVREAEYHQRHLIAHNYRIAPLLLHRPRGPKLRSFHRLGTRGPRWWTTTTP